MLPRSWHDGDFTEYYTNVALWITNMLCTFWRKASFLSFEGCKLVQLVLTLVMVSWLELRLGCPYWRMGTGRIIVWVESILLRMRNASVMRMTHCEGILPCCSRRQGNYANAEQFSHSHYTAASWPEIEHATSWSQVRCPTNAPPHHPCSLGVGLASVTGSDLCCGLQSSCGRPTAER